MFLISLKYKNGTRLGVSVIDKIYSMNNLIKTSVC